ncbi:MAG: hypothetical protein EPN97_12240 [Alphaproteobacteria bacterium]|nr:MAG: hypothetical protein EPN97_12240 [Alphaproteobacteria bacterium]
MSGKRSFPLLGGRAEGDEMDAIVKQIALKLDNLGIGYFVDSSGKLLVPLPNNFDCLSIGALKNDNSDTILEMVQAGWHTHGDLLNGSEVDEADAIVSFIEDILDGEILLIEEYVPGEQPRKFVEDDLELYLRNLPAGAEYKIYNK